MGRKINTFFALNMRYKQIYIQKKAKNAVLSTIR